SLGRRRGLRVIWIGSFLDSLHATPAPTVLHTPCPPDPSLAWARFSQGPGQFSLSGVTHTLCPANAARVLGDLLTAPYEPDDTLLCTSTAVGRMVRAVTGAYADYLCDRFNMRLELRPRLEVIPLGVNPERFRPPTPAERAASRKALRIADEEVAILFVG